MTRRRLLYKGGASSEVKKFSFNVCSLNIATSANLAHPWASRLTHMQEGEFFKTPYVIQYDGSSYSFHNRDGLDIIGFQEVANYNNQLNDIIDLLGSSYSYYNAYRGITTISTDNESCPIFYNNSRFKLVTGGKFWLSSTPDVESANWVGVKRICVWVILKEVNTNQKILVLNAHLPSYKLYNSSVQKGEAIRWSLNVIRNKINNIIEANGKMPIVLLGDLNANSDTKTANNKPIIQSMIAQTRIESGESIGTDYYFFNATTYGEHSLKESELTLISAGADYTMCTDSNNNWTIDSAFKSSSDPSYVQFDYVLLSRWPEGDGVYDTNTRMWCGHETAYSYITPFVSNELDSVCLSDHCAVVSRITVHSPNGWGLSEEKEDVSIMFELGTTGYNGVDDCCVSVRAVSDKYITYSLNLPYRAHVGSHVLSNTYIPISFTGNAQSVSSSVSLLSYEANPVVSFDRSIITGLDFIDKTNYIETDKYKIHFSYYNMFNPLSGVYLGNVEMNVKSMLNDVYLAAEPRSYLSNTRYNIYSSSGNVNYENNGTYSFNYGIPNGQSTIWQYGGTKTLFNSGTLLRGYSNNNIWYEKSGDNQIIEISIPYNFIRNGVSLFDFSDSDFQLSFAETPKIYLMGGSQITYSDYSVTALNGNILVRFAIDENYGSNLNSSFYITDFKIDLIVYPTNEIWYTTTNDQIIDINNDSFVNATIQSHVYENGRGVIKFVNNSISSINARGFAEITELESIYLPSSITYIGDSAFYGCLNLKDVYLATVEGIPMAGSSMFNGTSSDLSIHVPMMYVGGYQSASGWNGYASKIEGYE